MPITFRVWISAMLYLLHNWLYSWLVSHDLYRFTQVLDRVEFRAMAAAGVSFAIVLVLGPRVIGLLTRLKIGDSGATDAEILKSHANSKSNVPTMGGLLIVGSIMGSVVLLADIGKFYVILGLVVVLWHAVLGGFDDYLKLTAKHRGSGSRQGLYAWEKLIFQIGVGVLVGWFVFKQSADPNDVRHVLNLPFQKTYEPGAQGLNPKLIYLGLPAFILFATLMVAGMSNAVNITDGMDGLAAGVSAAVSIGVFILCLIAGNQAWAQYLLVPYVPEANELAVLAGATAGACLGFLWWNCPPAAVFMGDTGALSLGGVLGYIAVVCRQEVVLLIMSGVFIAEIGSVMLQVGYFKMTKGKRIFRVAPYHHHLHMIGWPEQQVVARFWIITVILIVIAIATLKMR